MERKTKTYQLNNTTYRFNSDKFAVLCNDRSKLMRVKKTSTSFLLQLEEDLDYEVSSSTIKGWIYGLNSPGTLELIEKVANVFRLDKMDLLIENERINKAMKNTNIVVDEKVREVVNEIYGRLIDGIKQYRYSEGFTDPAWGVDDDSTHMQATLEWGGNALELEDIIRKSRPYIDKNTVQSLLALNGEIFKYLEYENMTKSLFELSDNKEEPTEYQVFLGDNEDNYASQLMFLGSTIDSFNERLEEILVDYLA